MTYLRWNHKDIAAYVPSLYVRSPGRPKGAPDSEETTDEEGTVELADDTRKDTDDAKPVNREGADGLIHGVPASIVGHGRSVPQRDPFGRD